MEETKLFIKKETLEKMTGNYILDNGKIWAGTPDFIEVEVFNERDIKKAELITALKTLEAEIKVRETALFKKLKEKVKFLLED